MAASAFLKNIVSIEEWLATTREKKKHSTQKKTVPVIKHSNVQGESAFFRNNNFGL